MTLPEVADLIDSPLTEWLCRGNYINRRGIRGYYIQVKCGNYWCKVSVSAADLHADRLTVDELDEIDSTQLAQEVIIPRLSISYAIRTASEQGVSVNQYLNRKGIEGIWADFFLDGNWYMVSVSHIDVPTHPTPAELDRIADEFLRHQGSGRRKRRNDWLK